MSSQLKTRNWDSYYWVSLKFNYRMLESASWTVGFRVPSVVPSTTRARPNVRLHNSYNNDRIHLFVHTLQWWDLEWSYLFVFHDTADLLHWKTLHHLKRILVVCFLVTKDECYISFPFFISMFPQGLLNFRDILVSFPSNVQISDFLLL